LQDNPIIGRKLGWPLSEAYLLDGLFQMAFTWF